MDAYSGQTPSVKCTNSTTSPQLAPIETVINGVCIEVAPNALARGSHLCDLIQRTMRVGWRRVCRCFCGPTNFFFELRQSISALLWCQQHAVVEAVHLSPPRYHPSASSKRAAVEVWAWV